MVTSVLKAKLAIAAPLHPPLSYAQGTPAFGRLREPRGQQLLSLVTFKRELDGDHEQIYREIMQVGDAANALLSRMQSDADARLAVTQTYAATSDRLLKTMLRISMIIIPVDFLIEARGHCFKPMKENEIRSTLLLSVLRALWGAVPASLRQVTCGWQGTTVKLRIVFDGEIDPDDYEDAQVVGTEVIADFPSHWSLSEQIVRLDYPADLRKEELDYLVFLRKERTTNGEPIDASKLTR